MLKTEMTPEYYDLVINILKERRKENISHQEKEEIDKLLWLLTSVSEKVEKNGEYVFTMDLYARTLNDLVKHLLRTIGQLSNENKNLKILNRDLEAQIKRGNS